MFITKMKSKCVRELVGGGFASVVLPPQRTHPSEHLRYASHGCSVCQLQFSKTNLDKFPTPLVLERKAPSSMLNARGAMQDRLGRKASEDQAQGSGRVPARLSRIPSRPPVVCDLEGREAEIIQNETQ